MTGETLSNQRNILIKKASGESEPFSIDKLKRSLINAGADTDTVLKIVKNIDKWIYSGVTTKKIYARAFTLLRRERAPSNIRYRLKHAILEMGPTGYPFEILIGELFKYQGYNVEVGVVVDGKCVTHEMDVVATQNKAQHLVECKYHKDQGRQVSIQVPLYVRSRVNDIIETRQALPDFKGFNFSGWVITNTRFSSDSIDYGKCSGLNLLAWDYPNGKGLKNLIEEFKLYPITILSKLSTREKQQFLNRGVVTCKQLLENLNLSVDLKLSTKKQKIVLQELTEIGIS